MSKAKRGRAPRRFEYCPDRYPELFGLEPGDLAKLTEVPAIPPLRQKTGPTGSPTRRQARQADDASVSMLMMEAAVAKILLLQGANLTFLGRREPEIYGSTTPADLNAMLRITATNSKSSIPISKAKRSTVSIRQPTKASMVWS